MFFARILTGCPISLLRQYLCVTAGFSTLDSTGAMDSIVPLQRERRFCFKIRNEKDMKHILTGLKIIALSALLVAGFCGCASTEVQKSSAEKEREASYSSYVDKIDKEWGEHL